MIIGAKWQAHNKETSHCMIDDGVRGDHTCRRKNSRLNIYESNIYNMISIECVSAMFAALPS
jgi:hypothetical protein